MSDERAPGDPDGPGPAGEIVTLVLIHAHDELAGQLGDPTYAERPRPPA